MAVLLNKRGVAVKLAFEHKDSRDYAVYQRGGRAYRDKRVHIRRKSQKRGKAVFEEFEIDYRNGDRERELEKPEEIGVICKNRGGGDTNHVPHGDYHKSGGDYRRDYQTAQSRAEFVVGNAVLLCRRARCLILKHVACILERLFELNREL